MFYIKTFKSLSIITILSVLLLLGANSNSFASAKSAALAQRVSNAISNQYYQNFNVSANSKGIVRIEGNVNTLYDKYNIFDIVEKVRGVKGINDFITVNTPMLPDDIVQAGIENELRIDKSILEPNRIKVHVVNGIVVLSGTVSYYKEKLQAETVASWQKGATGIINQIKVLPVKSAVSDKNLSIIIKDIIKDRFPIDKKLHYLVKDGVVTLKGYSHNMWVTDHLQKDCLKIHGVKKVINDIKIAPEKYPNFI